MANSHEIEKTKQKNSWNQGIMIYERETIATQNQCCFSVGLLLKNVTDEKTHEINALWK